MTQEEIQLKLALDGADFESNIGRAEMRMESFGERAHHSFLHAEKPARAFHHLLGEISNQSGLAGEALTAMLSPTTAIISAIGGGFTFAIEKIKELNKELDETGKHNAQRVEVNDKLLRDQKAQSDKLQPGIVQARADAVLAESDSVGKLARAENLRTQNKDERDERLKQVKELANREAKIPGLIAKEEQLIEDLSKSGLDFMAAPDIYTGFGGHADPKVAAARQEQIEAAKKRRDRLQAQLGKDGEIARKREQLNKEIEERQKNVERLDLSSKEFELYEFLTAALPGSEKKIGRGFSSSSTNPFGIDVRTDVNHAPGVHEIFAREIIEFLKTGEAKVQVPNGK